MFCVLPVCLCCLSELFALSAAGVLTNLCVLSFILLLCLITNHPLPLLLHPHTHLF